MNGKLLTLRKAFTEYVGNNMQGKLLSGKYIICNTGKANRLDKNFMWECRLKGVKLI
jgi:hypothetical protein